MSLTFAEHTHDPDTCPAKDPEQGNSLLKYLSPVNAKNFGIKLLADAVLDGNHTFHLIREADDPEIVAEFMAPFKEAGIVEIIPASQCEKVFEREGC